MSKRTKNTSSTTIESTVKMRSLDLTNNKQRIEKQREKQRKYSWWKGTKINYAGFSISLMKSRRVCVCAEQKGTMWKSRAQENEMIMVETKQQSESFNFNKYTENNISVIWIVQYGNWFFISSFYMLELPSNYYKQTFVLFLGQNAICSLISSSSIRNRFWYRLHQWRFHPSSQFNASDLYCECKFKL